MPAHAGIQRGADAPKELDASFRWHDKGYLIMQNPTLIGPEAPPAAKGKLSSLIILLHGLGSDGQDLISLSPFFATALPGAHFLSPNAPFACDMAPMGYQWFSLMDWTPQKMLEGARQAAPILNAYIDAQLKRFSLPESKLALVGFSQGTMMALYTALHRAQPCAAVVGFSGGLIGGEGITARPPVCLIHGTDDPVVPFDAMGHAEELLKAHGVPVETHSRIGLQHGIDPGGIDIAARFLKSRL
jgi:phospholipase/carboxylesterase